jgi:hypothetical protein
MVNNVLGTDYCCGSRWLCFSRGIRLRKIRLRYLGTCHIKARRNSSFVSGRARPPFKACSSRSAVKCILSTGHYAPQFFYAMITTFQAFVIYKVLTVLPDRTVFSIRSRNHVGEENPGIRIPDAMMYCSFHA